MISQRWKEFDLSLKKEKERDALQNSNPPARKSSIAKSIQLARHSGGDDAHHHVMRMKQRQEALLGGAPSAPSAVLLPAPSSKNQPMQFLGSPTQVYDLLPPGGNPTPGAFFPSPELAAKQTAATMNSKKKLKRKQHHVTPLSHQLPLQHHTYTNYPPSSAPSTHMEEPSYMHHSVPLDPALGGFGGPLQKSFSAPTSLTTPTSLHIPPPTTMRDAFAPPHDTLAEDPALAAEVQRALELGVLDESLSPKSWASMKRLQDPSSFRPVQTNQPTQYHNTQMYSHPPTNPTVMYDPALQQQMTYPAYQHPHQQPHEQQQHQLHQHHQYQHQQHQPHQQQHQQYQPDPPHPQYQHQPQQQQHQQPHYQQQQQQHGHTPTQYHGDPQAMYSHDQYHNYTSPQHSPPQYHVDQRTASGRAHGHVLPPPLQASLLSSPNHEHTPSNVNYNNHYGNINDNNYNHNMNDSTTENHSPVVFVNSQTDTRKRSLHQATWVARQVELSVVEESQRRGVTDKESNDYQLICVRHQKWREAQQNAVTNAIRNILSKQQIHRDCITQDESGERENIQQQHTLQMLALKREIREREQELQEQLEAEQRQQQQQQQQQQVHPLSGSSGHSKFTGTQHSDRYKHAQSPTPTAHERSLSLPLTAQGSSTTPTGVRTSILTDSEIADSIINPDVTTSVLIGQGINQSMGTVSSMLSGNYQSVQYSNVNMSTQSIATQITESESSQLHFPLVGVPSPLNINYSSIELKPPSSGSDMGVSPSPHSQASVSSINPLSHYTPDASTSKQISLSDGLQMQLDFLKHQLEDDDAINSKIMDLEDDEEGQRVLVLKEERECQEELDEHIEVVVAEQREKERILREKILTQHKEERKCLEMEDENTRKQVVAESELACDNMYEQFIKKLTELQEEEMEVRMEEALQQLESSINELEEIEHQERQTVTVQEWQQKRCLVDYCIVITTEMEEDSARNQLRDKEDQLWGDLMKSIHSSIRHVKSQISDDILEMELEEFNQRTSLGNKIESEHWIIYEHIVRDEDTDRHTILYTFNYEIDHLRNHLLVLTMDKHAQEEVFIEESSRREMIETYSYDTWNHITTKCREIATKHTSSTLVEQESSLRIVVGKSEEVSREDLIQLFFNEKQHIIDTLISVKEIEEQQTKDELEELANELLTTNEPPPPAPLPLPLPSPPPPSDEQQQPNQPEKNSNNTQQTQTHVDNTLKKEEGRPTAPNSLPKEESKSHCLQDASTSSNLQRAEKEVPVVTKEFMHKYNALMKAYQHKKQKILQDERFEWNLMIDLMKEKVTIGM